jgi:hypothetical protein
MKGEIKMKERPIIMGADSVMAILGGLKTQTRRVVKPQPIHMPEGAYIDPYNHNYEHFTAWTLDNKMLLNCGGNIKNTAHWKCPYGVIGDRLWVRETWAEANYWTNDVDAETPIYRASDYKTPIKPVVWKSPMFMPRWASRITLEITDIRVERVQDITPEDALAEGIMSNEEYEARASEDNLFPCPRCEGYQVHEAFGYDYGITEIDCTYCNTQKKRYRIIWDSLNAKRGYSWESNPWVWVISFKVV